MLLKMSPFLPVLLGTSLVMPLSATAQPLRMLAIGRDAAGFAQTLEARANVSLVATGEMGGRSALNDALARLAAKTLPGDVVVIHLSGTRAHAADVLARLGALRADALLLLADGGPNARAYCRTAGAPQSPPNQVRICSRLLLGNRLRAALEKGTLPDGTVGARAFAVALRAQSSAEQQVAVAGADFVFASAVPWQEKLDGGLSRVLAAIQARRNADEEAEATGVRWHRGRLAVEIAVENKARAEAVVQRVTDLGGSVTALLSNRVFAEVPPDVLPRVAREPRVWSVHAALTDGLPQTTNEERKPHEAAH